MKNWELARRDLLKQLGVGLACLPALYASGARAADEKASKKLIIILASEGYRMNQWKPPTGPLKDLPMSCKPLDRHKDHLLFMPDMTNPNYKGGERFGHEAYGSIFWGGAKTKGSNKYQEPVGSSVDQYVSDELGKVSPTPEKSLAFQVQLDRKPDQKVPGGNRCFWRDGSPVNPESNPQDTYGRLFAGANPGNPGAGDGAKKLIAQKKSILDYVGKNLNSFKMRVSSEDQKAIDRHLGSVRDLENQLSGMGPPLPGKVGVTDPGAYTKEAILSTDNLYPKIMGAYMEMLVAGVASGITNVATLQISDSTGNQINFGSFVPNIPPRGTNYKTSFRNWHDLGHNPNMGGVDHHRIVDEWCMTRFSEFLDKVKAVPTAGGTLLDTGLVLWGNHMEDGESHASQKVPWLFAGKAGGRLNTGQCAATGGKSIQGALADICFAMGVEPKDPFVGTMPGVRKA